MPEGHTLHRLARDQQKLFGGSPVHASSPQGRFAVGAGVLDGRVLERGELKLVYHDGGFRIEYFENRFPAAPAST